MTSSGRRLGVRLFVLIVLCAMAIDVIPRSWPLGRDTREQVSLWLSHVGLSQREWAMFAPDPGIRSAQLTAEIELESDDVVRWESPSWATATAWEKFRHFRAINYYDRLLTNDSIVLDDFSAYLARVAIRAETGPSASPLETWTFPPTSSTVPATNVRYVRIYKQELRLLRPIDAGFPVPDDMTWASSSELISSWSREK